MLAMPACKREVSVSFGTPVLPVVTDDSTSVLLTWIDDKGEFHREAKAADVPPNARELVRVLDADHEPPEGEIYLVDLRAKSAGGGYPVRTAPRGDFEKIAAGRRGDKALASHPPIPLADDGAPQSVPGEAGAPTAQPLVIIYGAEWCGPCHQVQAYLKKRNSPFVEKDIDNDRAAAKEMQAKLTKAGIRGGSIPVIDVHGRLLVGFDARAIDRALAN